MIRLTCLLLALAAPLPALAQAAPSAAATTQLDGKRFTVVSRARVPTSC